MQRAAVTFLGVVALGVLAAQLLPVQVWDGHFPVTVHWISDRPPDSILCIPLPNEQYAERAAVETHPEGAFSVVIRPEGNAPFVVRIPVSGRRGCLGLIDSRTPFRFLFVEARFENGTARRRVLPVHDSPHPSDRGLSVEF